MNILRGAIAIFLILTIVLDVFAMNGEKQYGDPFTKHVLAGKVEAVFSKASQCGDDTGVLYRLRVDEALRGGSKFETVLVLASYRSDFVKVSDRQIVFLMDVDSSVPKRLEKCYQKSVFDSGESIGYVDYFSSEGVFKIIDNSSGGDFFYSTCFSDEPRIALSDRLFDGQALTLKAQIKNDGSKCIETVGSLEDLMRLVTGSFADISLKSNDSVKDREVSP